MTSHNGTFFDPPPPSVTLGHNKVDPPLKMTSQIVKPPVLSKYIFCDYFVNYNAIPVIQVARSLRHSIRGPQTLALLPKNSMQ